MPLFAEALRDSKLFTLPPRSVARCIKSADVPKHQVLETTSASAHRRDWGLKFPVAGAKSKQVEFESFEDRFATNGANAFPKFPRKIANLEYIGSSVTLPRSRHLRSLYDSPSEAMARAPKQKGLEFLTDSEFQNKLQEAKKLDASKVGDRAEALRKLNIPAHDPMGNSEPVKWQNSGIGASYASPGVLRNSPRGIYSQRTVKARAMPGRAHRGAVAFGGFVATDTNGQTAQVPWFETQELSVQSVASTTSGALQINVHRETPHSSNYFSSSSVLDKVTNV